MCPLDGRELTFTVNQSAPSANGAIQTPVGGSWNTGPYCFKVVAWFTDGETRQDNAGLTRSDVALWTNITPTLNDQILINWTAAARAPDHYSIYYIGGATTWKIPSGVDGTATGPISATELIDATATFDVEVAAGNLFVGDTVRNITTGYTAVITGINTAIKVTTNTITGNYNPGDIYTIERTGIKTAEVGGDITTVTIAAPANTGSLVLSSASETTFVVNPIIDTDMDIRQQHGRAYNGRINNLSYAQFSPLNAARYTIVCTSITETNYNLLAIWLTQNVRVRVTESSGAAAVVSPLDGFVDKLTYYPSRYKNNKNTFSVEMMYEAGTLT